MEDKTAEYFQCSDRERAAFEAGIKLATVFHQFTGLPITLKNVEYVERCIEECLKVQPFVQDAHVRIDRSMLRNKEHEYDYTTLHASMLDVEVVVRYKGVVVTSQMKYIAELEYPLMFIKEVREADV